MSGVSTPDIQPVPDEDGAQSINDTNHATRPKRVAEPAPFVFADICVITESPAHRCLGQFEMRGESATVEQGATQTGAQGEDKFKTLTRDDACGMELGIVQHESGRIESLGHRGARIESMPLVNEIGQDPTAWASSSDVVGSRDDHAVADHSRQTDTCPVRGGQARGKVNDGVDESRGRERIGSGHADGLCAHRAALIKNGRLEPAAPAINNQGGQGGFGRRVQVRGHGTSVCRVTTHSGSLTGLVRRHGGVA